MPYVNVVQYKVIEYPGGDKISLENTTDNSKSEFDYSKIAPNFYIGEFKPDFNYNEAVELHLVITQETGSDKGNKLQDVTVYTSKENWDKFVNDTNIKEESLSTCI